jgi:hypothetical protein
MHPNPLEPTPKKTGLFCSGEITLACGLVFLALTMALTHFVMGLFLAVVPALFAGLCVTDGLTRARNGSAPAGRQWMGVALVLIALAVLVAVTFNAASLSYKLALHAQRPTSPVPNIGEWVLNLGSGLIPALLMWPGLSFWTNWSRLRRQVWCVLILAVPPITILLHTLLASWGGPLSA